MSFMSGSGVSVCNWLSLAQAWLPSRTRSVTCSVSWTRYSELKLYRSKVSEIGTEIINASKRNKKLIADHLKTVTGDVKSVFTYSYSGTVVDVIREMGYRNIIVTESRPMLEGRRLAKELGEDGFNVLLVVDGAAAMYVKAADICLIGADSVQYNGSAVNKVGSKLLGYAAKDQGIPFYVLCDTSKFNVLNYLGDSIELEEKNSRRGLRAHEECISQEPLL